MSDDASSSTAEGEPVLVSTDGAAVILTINRPAARNALDRRSTAALTAAIEHAQRMPEARVIVITGSGSAFCSGDDVREITILQTSGFAESIRGLQRLTSVLLSSELPVIAAINGAALGAGLELTLACDIRVASTRAIFGCPEATLGMVVTNAASVLLPRIVGTGRAAEMLLSGRSYGPEWALAAGLVTVVVTEEEFWREVAALADVLSNCSVTSLRLTRELLRPPQIVTDEALEREFAAVMLARQGPDAEERLATFLQRRAPGSPRHKEKR